MHVYSWFVPCPWDKSMVPYKLLEKLAFIPDFTIFAHINLIGHHLCILLQNILLMMKCTVIFIKFANLGEIFTKIINIEKIQLGLKLNLIMCYCFEFHIVSRMIDSLSDIPSFNSYNSRLVPEACWSLSVAGVLRGSQLIAPREHIVNYTNPAQAIHHSDSKPQFVPKGVAMGCSRANLLAVPSWWYSVVGRKWWLSWHSKATELWLMGTMLASFWWSPIR